MAESHSGKDAKSSRAEGSEGSEDENKRKFREALERKMAKSAGGAEHKDGGGKQSRVHGRAETRREFRRKSG
ncbi:DUF5302 domain-containing protein [Mycobacterium sp.]|uniref:DUF5302 domain-containing protein n=1 Tax=Mycobacterium sp. TaxID=1785 RepID=UPI003BA9627F